MIKTGIWQVVELMTVIFNIYFASVNHGKFIQGKKEFDELQNHSSIVRDLTYIVALILMLAFGPLLAYLGGCAGLPFMLYCSVCFLSYIHAIHSTSTGKAQEQKISVFKTTGLMIVYNILLYLGGFWTVVRPL